MRNSNERSLYESLRQSITLSGSEIYKLKTNRENHFRSRLSKLSYSLVSLLERHGLAATTLVDAVIKLRVAKNDSRHYGDNQPGSYFDDPQRTPVVPDPRFSFWDLYQFGVTGPDGFAGFLELSELDASIDNATLQGIIGLLLIDSAVESLDRSDMSLAAADAMEAATCLEQMILDRSYHALAKASRTEFARKGGVERHAETNANKQNILDKWDSGVFDGNKTAAGNWAHQNFEVNVETARKWIREHEKNK